jgi:hypothetical protein
MEEKGVDSVAQGAQSNQAVPAGGASAVGNAPNAAASNTKIVEGNAWDVDQLQLEGCRTSFRQHYHNHWPLPY